MIEELPVLPILLFSIIVHEIAHGWLALRLGDPTAKNEGRLTLNPLPHIDPVGSVLVPLVSIAAAGHVLIAWAKPVPVNRSNFSHPRRDDILVSAIGPVSNLLLALACASAAAATSVVLRGMLADGSATAIGLMKILFGMFYGGTYLNVVLAVFNLLPVPPLDGSHVFAAALPPRAAAGYQRIGFLGVLIFLMAMRLPVVNQAFFAAIGAMFAPFRTLAETFL
jgi:Zn-dependent protease